MKAFNNIPGTKNLDMKLFVIAMAVLSVALCMAVIIDDSDCTEADVEDDYFVYSINESEGTASVQGLTGVGKQQSDLVIPATMTYGGKEYTVTDIGNWAFSNKDYAFKSIKLGENVKRIGNSAFYWVTSLETVEFDDNLETIGGTAFFYCPGLKKLDIGRNVTTIGDSAFMLCTNVKEINYNARNVTNFEGGAFNKCGAEKLTLIVGDDVEMIPAYMFENNNRLRTVSINKSLTQIGDCAFKGCIYLTKIINRASETTNEDPQLTIGNSAFEGCALEIVILTDNVICIGDRAFYGNNTLTAVAISGSVRTFGNYAFGNCSAIDKLAFGDLAEDLDVKDHVFSHEENNETVDYKFKNMNDSREYTFTDALAEKGTFDNRAYDMMNGKAVNVFLVTLDANGGECPDQYIFTDENGILTSELPIPTKSGCTFEGWYDGYRKVSTGDVLTENTVLTAKWSGSQSSNNNAFVWIIVAIIIIVAALLMTVMVMSRKH